MADGVTIGAYHWAALLLICFILPACITWTIAEVMRKAGLIAFSDLKLPE